MANTTLSKDEILDAIGGMTVLELSELVEAFKEKFNVTIAAAPVGWGSSCRWCWWCGGPSGRGTDGVRR